MTSASRSYRVGIPSLVLVATLVLQSPLWAALCDTVPQLQKRITDLSAELTRREDQLRVALDRHQRAVDGQGDDLAQRKQTVDAVLQKTIQARQALTDAMNEESRLQAAQSSGYDAQAAAVAAFDRARGLLEAARKVRQTLDATLASDPAMQQAVGRKQTAERMLTRDIGNSFLEGLSAESIAGLERLDEGLAMVPNQPALDPGNEVERFSGDSGSRLSQLQDELRGKEETFAVVRHQGAARTGTLQAEIAHLRSEITEIAREAQRQSSILRGVWVDGDLEAAEFAARDSLEADEQALLLGLESGTLTGQFDEAKTDLDVQNSREQNVSRDVARLQAERGTLEQAVAEAEAELTTAEAAHRAASDLDSEIRSAEAERTQAEELRDETARALQQAQNELTRQQALLDTLAADVTSRAQAAQGILRQAAQAGASGQAQACLEGLENGRREMQTAAQLLGENRACLSGDSQRVFQTINDYIARAETIDCGSGASLAPTVVVPDVSTATTLADAVAILGPDLTPQFRAILVPPTRAEAENVISQSPPAGLRVAAGTDVIISHYEGLRSVPSGLIGVPFQQADQILGFNALIGNPVEGDPAPDDRPGLAGQVYDVSPAAGSTLLPTDPVTITYYRAPRRPVDPTSPVDTPGLTEAANPFDTAADRGSLTGPGTGPPAVSIPPVIEAIEARNQASLDDAEAAIRRCDYQTAQSLIDHVRNIQPGHPDLPFHMAELNRGIEAEREVLSLLQQAAAFPLDVDRQVVLLRLAQTTAPCPRPQMNQASSQLISRSAGAARNASAEAARSRSDVASTLIGTLIQVQTALIEGANRQGERAGGSPSSGPEGSSTSPAGGSSTAGTSDGGAGGVCTITSTNLLGGSVASFIVVDPADARPSGRVGHYLTTEQKGRVTEYVVLSVEGLDACAPDDCVQRLRSASMRGATFVSPGGSRGLSYGSRDAARAAARAKCPSPASSVQW